MQSLRQFPSHCGCSKVYTVHHALLCKKGNFVILRQNELLDNIGEMLQKVINNVRKELVLEPLTGEDQPIGGNASVEAWTDISTRGFWCHGQRAFFDVRIFNPNTQGHENKAFKRYYELIKHEKKRDYNSRILNVEQDSFTPLVFSTTIREGKYEYGKVVWEENARCLSSNCVRWSH